MIISRMNCFAQMQSISHPNKNIKNNVAPNYEMGNQTQLVSQVYYQPSFKGNYDPACINQFKNYTIEEYKSLSPDVIENVRQHCDEVLYAPSRKSYFESYEKDHDLISNSIINSLNEKYGKDSWTLITMGQSLSSVCTVVGYKAGEDKVKHIPMSSAGRFLEEGAIEGLKGTDGIKCLNEYLESIGLTKEELENPDKKFVLVDYCDTGDSLNGAYNLLKSDLVFGENANLYKEDIMDLVPTSNPSFNKFRAGLRCQCYKRFSPFGRCEDLEETKTAFKPSFRIWTEDKLMRFKFLDNVMQGKSFESKE